MIPLSIPALRLLQSLKYLQLESQWEANAMLSSYWKIWEAPFEEILNIPTSSACNWSVAIDQVWSRRLGPNGSNFDKNTHLHWGRLVRLNLFFHISHQNKRAAALEACNVAHRYFAVSPVYLGAHNASVCQNYSRRMFGRIVRSAEWRFHHDLGYTTSLWVCWRWPPAKTPVSRSSIARDSLRVRCEGRQGLGLYTAPILLLLNLVI